MPIYQQSVRQLIREMVTEFALERDKCFTKGQAIDWFAEHYPLINSGTISKQLLVHSTNARSRIHHRVRPGEDDLFFQVDGSRFRLFDSARDPAPTYASATPSIPQVSSAVEVPRLRSQITGNVGLYYCCYRLSMMGWNVMPTARNARGVDIIAYSSDASRFIGVQVKSLSKRNPVPIGTSSDKVMGDFWIVVTQLNSPQPKAYALLPAEVKDRIHRGEKDGRVLFWLQPNRYDHPDFREAWARIGNGHDRQLQGESTAD